ncbi:MAG: hypothetical protein CVU39_25100 [Chloroflexi bacterium HGW-Chloroflexi-10]|nr:MAG: hypothetical protein CVU39_25100 [Chloroflexi bacterium HGW-Chloroflexi-10]
MKNDITATIIHSTNYTRRLEYLLEICRNLSANLELEPLLYALIESASELTQSESSSILVFDKDNQQLRFAAAPFYQMESLATLGVPLDRSVAGWVYTNCQPVILHEAEKDNRLFQVADRETSGKTTSIIAVPMVYRGQTVGVMEAINKHNGGRFIEEDVSILETLASQAAIAIHNQVLLDDKEAAFHKAMELDRMKGDFIAIASHELRTPLGLILGHASFLYETVESDEQKNWADTILRSAMRLKEIIEDFSDVEKLENGLTRLRRGQVQLSLLVQDTVDAFTDIAKDQKIFLNIESLEENLQIDGDTEKIAIALRNLIENALYFNKPGGRVQIKAERIPGYIRIGVADNGIGIAAADQQKVFQRFYQVETHLTRHHNGMGLGLSIAKDLIEMHGGRITLQSQLDRGSIFTILLPLSSAQADAANRVFMME